MSRFGVHCGKNVRYGRLHLADLVYHADCPACIGEGGILSGSQISSGVFLSSDMRPQNSCHGSCDCTQPASCTLDIAASYGNWDGVLARCSGQYADEWSLSESSGYTRVESELWVAVRKSKSRRYPPFAAQRGR